MNDGNFLTQSFFRSGAAWVASMCLFGSVGLSTVGFCKTSPLVEQLQEIRAKTIEHQAKLIESVKKNRKNKENVLKLKTLATLQAKERDVAQSRIKEIESTIKELEFSRGEILEKIRDERTRTRKLILALKRTKDESDRSLLDAPMSEQWEAPKRKFVSNLAKVSLKNLEMHSIDLKDSNNIERSLDEEKSSLVSITEEMKSQEKALELNRKIQLELLAKDHEERLRRLEEYQALRESQLKVEKLLGEFNARKELSEAQNDSMGTKSHLPSVFGSLKGKLPWPMDPLVAQLRVESNDGFSKRGIEFIPDRANVAVTSVADGVVAFAGTLNGLGNVVILDHGDQFYTLVGKLNSLSVKNGDSVKSQALLGVSADVSQPVYFEVRSRNVPLDPKQWVAIQKQ